MSCTQVSNEYGMCGKDPAYLRQLVAMVKAGLGRATIVYTTDPPWLLQQGSLPGTEMYTCVPLYPRRSLLSFIKLGTRPGGGLRFCYSAIWASVCMCLRTVVQEAIAH